jgi:lysophospholipid acyltransferase (LPLAT)-like uncharacterized protein
MTWWRRLLFRITVPIALGLMRATWATYRFEIHGDEKLQELFAAGKPVVLGFWHESLLVVSWYAARLLKAGERITFLISPSVDGEFGVMMLAHYGSEAVRGSATRSGVSALRGLYRAIRRDGMSPAITLDGPKGPVRYCKPGAVMVARMAGVPIVPIGCGARRSFRAPTWDRHLVPLATSIVVLKLGEPVTVPADASGEDIEAVRVDLERRVNKLMGEAEVLAVNRKAIATERQEE